ncbi:MAG TPA: hypothetical protein VLG50_03120 [Candidatus Saccharimonadales bacterium]|nr:hypothetical protein [Candidatus Saccharimonadales bacterium]
MFAQSLLSKLPKLLKSSRIVLAFLMICGNASLILSQENEVIRSVTPQTRGTVRNKIQACPRSRSLSTPRKLSTLDTEQNVISGKQHYKRSPNWPALRRTPSWPG